MNDYQPLISVIIPAYNCENFISKTLDSVKNQTFGDFEIIVVDDGSKDNTKRVVDDYLKTNGLRGQCIKQENKQIAAARNTGMKAAKGKYVSLLDHDDIWHPEKLEKTVDIIKRFPDVSFIAHKFNFVLNKKIIRVSKTIKNDTNIHDMLLFDENRIGNSTVTFNRESALALGGFNERTDFNTAEDYDMWIRLSETAKFHFINEVLSDYTLIPNSPSSRTKYHHDNVFKVVNSHFDKIKNKSWTIRMKIRHRKSKIYRSALNQLLRSNVLSEETDSYAKKMFSTYPFSVKNVIRITQWFLKRKLHLPIPSF
jgi:glycosyltransferase involved in cell wall biosynthesis